MAFEKFPPTNAAEAIAVLKQDTVILHDVVHGTDTQEVLTENGLIPSVAKTLADIKQRILDNLSPETVVEKKLYSELVGNVFDFTTLTYTPSTDPTKYPINVYINGNLTFDFEQTSPTSITLTVLTAEPDDEVVVTSNLINTFNVGGTSAAMYVTLEQFDQEAGTGGDDTAAFESACLASASSGKYVLLLGKTYLIEPKPFTATVDYTVSGIVGVKGSKIAPFGPLKVDPEFQALLHIKVLDNGLLQNFTVDANISQSDVTPNVDPVTWSAANFDVWYGSRGLIVRDSNDYRIDRVIGMNAYAAPISEFGPTNSLKTNCLSIRGRGRNGDLYYINAAVGCTEINCVAYDGTRIGFVSEAFVADTRLSTRIKRINCSAVYLHDQSVDLTGTEFNAGFWDEHSYDVTHEQCHAEDFGRFAFKSSFVVELVKVPSLNGRVTMPYIYKDCTAVNGDIMFQSATQQAEYPVKTLIEDCHGVNINWRFADCGALAMVNDDYFEVNNSTVILSPVVGTVIQAGVLCYSGEVKVDDLEVRYLGRNMTDYLDPTNSSKTISHFGSTASKKVRVNNLKVFDESGLKIGATICFRSTTTTTNLIVTDTELFGIDNRCGFCTYQNVVLNPLSTEVHKSFRVLDSEVKSIAGDASNFEVVSAINGQLDVKFDNVVFDLTTWSSYLHLFNSSKNSSEPLAKITNCKFRWDAAANGYVIRLNADTSFKNTINGIYNWEFSGNEFINTGAETSNPIIFTDGSVANAMTAYGVGNYKSATLLVDGSPTLISNY